MRFTPYQVIILVAVICGFLLMYSGSGGIDVLLFLCGVSLLLAAGVSNRGVVVRLAVRSFKFGMNLLPSRSSDFATDQDQAVSSDDSQNRLPNPKRIEALQSSGAFFPASFLLHSSLSKRLEVFFRPFASRQIYQGNRIKMKTC